MTARPVAVARQVALRLAPPLVIDAALAARRALRERRGRVNARQWRTVSNGNLRGTKLKLPSGVGEEWGEAMLEGSFEEACTTVMQSLVSAGSACFDVGGHIGYYSLLLAELTGSTGAVHCFEPFAANAARIRDHVAANSPRARINLHELALSDRSGTAVMVAGGGADGRSSMSHLEDARGVMGAWSNGVFAAFSRVPVQRRRLDDMWADGIVPSPDFIKIDVEGSEAQVLRGASNLLRHAQPSLLIELHNSALAVECAALLTRAGYWPGVVSLPSSERCVVTATPPGTPVPQMAMAAVSTAALR